MSEDIRNTFKKSLITLMEINNINQVELANAIDVSRTTVNNWVLGYNVPRMDKIDLLCDYFGVSRDYMIGSPTSHKEESYYSDKETQEIADNIYKDKNLRMLFDASRDLSPEDIKTVVEMVKILKKRGK